MSDTVNIEVDQGAESPTVPPVDDTEVTVIQASPWPRRAASFGAILSSLSALGAFIKNDSFYAFLFVLMVVLLVFLVMFRTSIRELMNQRILSMPGRKNVVVVNSKDEIRTPTGKE